VTEKAALLPSQETELNVWDRNCQPPDLNTVFAITLQMDAWKIFGGNKEKVWIKPLRDQCGSTLVSVQKYYGTFGGADGVGSRCCFYCK